MQDFEVKLHVARGLIFNVGMSTRHYLQFMILSMCKLWNANYVDQLIIVFIDKCPFIVSRLS